MTSIVGKTILLTGASRGLGALVATLLAQESRVTLVGISRSGQGLATVGAEVMAAGAEWVAIPFDISQIEQLPQLVEQVYQTVGPVDILINNAGIETYSAFQDYSVTDLQQVMNTNLIAAMELSRLLLPKMIDRGGGHIVNITSLAAKKGHPYDSIYSASKGGLQMWSDAIRQELAGTGVEVSIVCPGYISDQGLMASTGVPAPKLAGSSTAEQVARAIVQVIRDDRAEIWVNQNWFQEIITKILFGLSAVFPNFSDYMYRFIGIPEANRQRIKSSQLRPMAKSEGVSHQLAASSDRTSMKFL
jgi:short-subunit dehydrogenase